MKANGMAGAVGHPKGTPATSTVWALVHAGVEMILQHANSAANERDRGVTQRRNATTGAGCGDRDLARGNQISVTGMT